MTQLVGDATGRVHDDHRAQVVVELAGGFSDGEHLRGGQLLDFTQVNGDDHTSGAQRQLQRGVQLVVTQRPATGDSGQDGHRGQVGDGAFSVRPDVHDGRRRQ